MARGNGNAASEKATKEPGPFVVLRPADSIDGRTITATDGDGNAVETSPLFEVVGEYVGKTSKQAIGKAVGEHGGGTYVAVPKRSFTPRAVESVGVPRLKWS